MRTKDSHKEDIDKLIDKYLDCDIDTLLFIPPLYIEWFMFKSLGTNSKMKNKMPISRKISYK